MEKRLQGKDIRNDLFDVVNQQTTLDCCRCRVKVFRPIDSFWNKQGAFTWAQPALLNSFNAYYWG